jgi:hypothetical protein
MNRIYPSKAILFEVESRQKGHTDACVAKATA